jgi:solute carrier family 6 amino acid transporter-like protein 5/7/9/14
VQGALLEGALEGIKYYIVPDWNKLASAKVWIDAAGQVFFSLSVAMGGLMALASYNKFNNNIYRDSILIVTMDTVTSLLSGFAVFSILGYLANILEKEVPDVVASGFGLVFVVYPEAVTYLPPPQLWATLFFLMLITLGIDSQFAGIEAIMTPVTDTFKNLRSYKPVVALVICLTFYLLGFTMCTQAGVYWTELISYYANGWCLVFMAFAESIVIGWVYGASNLIDNVEEMIGYRLNRIWWFMWTFLTPLLLGAILVFNMIDFTPLSYGDYLLPDWAQALGWLMTVSTLVPIPVYMIFIIWRSYSNPEYDDCRFLQRLVKLTKPSSTWSAKERHDASSQGSTRQLYGAKERDGFHNCAAELDHPHTHL